MFRRHKEITLITAGFPCQDVSIAGDRAGLSGKHTGLFWELARIIKATTPDWFVLENVPGLLSSNGGEDMATVIKTLSEIGYCVAWRVLDAQYFGVAQKRSRLWIVGSFGNTSASEILFEQESGGRNDTKIGKIRQRGLCLSTRTGDRQDPTAETYIANVIQASDYEKTQHGQFGNEGNLIASAITTYSEEKYPPSQGRTDNLVAHTIGSVVRGNSSFVWQDTHIAETDTVGKRKTDGIPRGMDRHRGSALGNSIVPQVAFEIFQAIRIVEQL